MRNLRLPAVALAIAFALSILIFSISSRTATSAPQADEPIRVKGGSLSIECPGNQDCLGTPSNGRYNHRNNGGKINKIVVKNTQGDILFSVDEASALGPRPEIEIYYK